MDAASRADALRDVGRRAAEVARTRVPGGPAVFESAFGCTFWLPKTNVDDAGGAAPVPVNGIDCGLPVALSAMRSCAG